ncbi:hypothetical protein Tco_0946231, partial [Tanacetum coccineum]
PLRCTSGWCFDEKLFVQTLYKIDFSNELHMVDAFEKEMERASTYLLSSSLPELVETYYGRSFVGTSDGYFSILFLLAGRS